MQVSARTGGGNQSSLIQKLDTLISEKTKAKPRVLAVLNQETNSRENSRTKGPALVPLKHAQNASIEVGKKGLSKGSSLSRDKRRQPSPQGFKQVNILSSRRDNSNSRPIGRENQPPESSEQRRMRLMSKGPPNYLTPTKASKARDKQDRSNSKQREQSGEVSSRLEKPVPLRNPVPAKNQPLARRMAVQPQNHPQSQQTVASMPISKQIEGSSTYHKTQLVSGQSKDSNQQVLLKVTFKRDHHTPSVTFKASEKSLLSQSSMAVHQPAQDETSSIPVESSHQWIVSKESITQDSTHDVLVPSVRESLTESDFVHLENLSEMGMFSGRGSITHQTSQNPEQKEAELNQELLRLKVSQLFSRERNLALN